MKVHDGIVHSLVAVHYGVGVKSDNQVISEFGTLLQEVLKLFLSGTVNNSSETKLNKLHQEAQLVIMIVEC